MVDPSPEEPNYAKQSRTALRGLFIIAIIAAMYVARDFLLPVVLASFIALTFRPAVRFLSRHYIPPWLSATLLADHFGRRRPVGRLHAQLAGFCLD